MAQVVAKEQKEDAMIGTKREYNFVISKKYR